jgi:hypothetical protein
VTTPVEDFAPLLVELLIMKDIASYSRFFLHGVEDNNVKTRYKSMIYPPTGWRINCTEVL